MFAEPSPRHSHFFDAIGEKLYVWGGYTEDFKEKNTLASVLHSFHSVLESWEHQEYSGTLPPVLYDGACVSTGGHLYLYGGYDGSYYRSGLYELDTKSRSFKLLSSGGPMRKSGCAMIAYGKKLVLFGGRGILSDPIQPGAQFVKDTRYTNSEGWTNELHMFDLEEGEDGM